MENPKVSVIVPAYNSATFLVETLNSAFLQTYRNTEIIVVNDGSTDNTEEVLRPYFDRIVYIAQENKGLPGALNTGLSRARGEYVAILDADDLWEHGKVQAQLDLMEKHSDVGLCYTNFLTFGDPVNYRSGFDENDGALTRYCREKVAPDAYVITSPTLLNDLLIEQGVPKPSSVMIRRDCFDKVGTFNEHLTFCQDTQMTFRIAKHYRFGYIDRCLLKRRIHAKSLASTQSERRYVLEHIEMFSTLDQYMVLTAAERASRNRVLAGYYNSAGYLEFSDCKLISSRHYLRKGLSLHFTLRTFIYFLLTLLPEALFRCLRSLKRSMPRKSGHRDDVVLDSKL